MTTSSRMPFIAARRIRIGTIHQICCKPDVLIWVLIPISTANR